MSQNLNTTFFFQQFFQLSSLLHVYNLLPALLSLLAMKTNILMVAASSMFANLEGKRQHQVVVFEIAALFRSPLPLSSSPENYSEVDTQTSIAHIDVRECLSLNVNHTVRPLDCPHQASIET